MLLIFLFLPVASAFECYVCGVFLSAPTSNCKGIPKPINCSDSYSPHGCISIIGRQKVISSLIEAFGTANAMK
ncbi:unnamed protein product [Dracunculus medinensis]|uniref:Secreted protein n=1 Tax=Dracunculus medinensis TaxID=318479 RepID=A0A0N4UGR3_DRAME|nr:unnamed protein product [Dracunculus medinensis]